MKKMIMFLLLLGSFSAHADHMEIWARIKELAQAIGEHSQQIQNNAIGLTNLQVQVNAIPAPITYNIGQEYRGGIIFYVDESGQHGLIASKIDCSGQGIQWRNGNAGNKTTNARSDGIGAGESNTRLIIAQQTIDNQTGNFAALAASNFQVLSDGVTPCKTPLAPNTTCYGGWYLPSAYELQLLHTNLHSNNLSTFAPEFYWSSTEANVTNAWLINFATGEVITSSKANTLGHIRAIARF